MKNVLFLAWMCGTLIGLFSMLLAALRSKGSHWAGPAARRGRA